MNHNSINKMLSVTKIPSRGTFLKMEEMLGIQTPRDGRGRYFPDRLVENLAVLQGLLNELEIPLGELLSWEQTMRLAQPRDEWSMRDFSDPYWAAYFRQTHADMKAATVDVHELTRWEHELMLTYPTDDHGNIALDEHWCKYLRAVQEAYAAGRNTYWCVYNIQNPAQLGLVPATAIAPEY